MDPSDSRKAVAAADAGTPVAPALDRWLGPAVFFAWLLLVASGFWNLIILPMQAQAALANDPAQRAAVEGWVRGAISRHAATGGPIVLVDPAACGCVASAAVSLAGRLRASGVAVVDLPRDAPRLAQRPEVAVLGGDGRLRYAGPAMPSLFCTTGRSLVEAAVQDESGGGAALVLPAECACDRTLALR